MNNFPAHPLLSGFRGVRLAVHLVNGILLAIVYPHLNSKRQLGILKNWSRQLLTIFNIGVQIEGRQRIRREGAY